MSKFSKRINKKAQSSNNMYNTYSYNETLKKLCSYMNGKDYRSTMDYEDLDNVKIGTAEKAVRYADMGIGCKRRGEYEKSVLCYKKSLELNPKQGMTYYNLGKVLYLTGKYEEAQRAYYMAYIYEAGVFSNTLCRHIGHAVLDAEPDNRYTNAIKEYALSIAGRGGYGGIDEYYECKCTKKGEETLQILKEKLKEFEASNVE